MLDMITKFNCKKLDLFQGYHGGQFNCKEE